MIVSTLTIPVTTDQIPGRGQVVDPDGAWHWTLVGAAGGSPAQLIITGTTGPAIFAAARELLDWTGSTRLDRRPVLTLTVGPVDSLDDRAAVLDTYDALQTWATGAAE